MGIKIQQDYVLVVLEAFSAFTQLGRCHSLSLRASLKSCTPDDEVHMAIKAMRHSKDYYMHTDCAGAPTCLYT